MKNKIFLILVSQFILSYPAFSQIKGPTSTNLTITDTLNHNPDTSITKTCIDCHSNLTEKKIKHVTKTGNACKDCHNDNADHPKTDITLQNKLPDLCLSCHDEQKELITESPYVHGALNDKSSCTICHSPHSSDIKKLLVTNRKDLCLSCHNKSTTTTNKTTTNYEKLMKTSKVLHSPFEDCEKVCHNPHASQDYRLLDFPFVTNNYLVVNTDSFALCWECHGSDLIQKPKTKGSTQFRNGEDNLHYVHVHGEKGRSCMICHSPHATNNQHLIRETVHFGNWDFRMNYISDENGGSCAPGCHSEKKYTR